MFLYPLIFILLSLCTAEHAAVGIAAHMCFDHLPQASSWAATASPKEILAELMMIDCSIADEAYLQNGQIDAATLGNANSIDRAIGLIETYGLNSLFFRGRGKTTRLVDFKKRILQAAHGRDIWFGIDAEWIGMRFTDQQEGPHNGDLAQSADPETVVRSNYQEIGRQMRALGIHMIPAPVVDIANTGFLAARKRVFSNDPATVATLGKIALLALLKENIVAGPKHFPGHGDAKKLDGGLADSHIDLPVVSKKREELDNRELIPYKIMLPESPLLMSGHLLIPELDPQMPATLSPQIMAIADELGFKGLKIADALDMKAIGAVLTPVEANMRALEAIDILLMPQSLEATFEAALMRMSTDKNFEKTLRSKAERVRAVKLWSFAQLKD